jgi:hypothetical protein
MSPSLQATLLAEVRLAEGQVGVEEEALNKDMYLMYREIARGPAVSKRENREFRAKVDLKKELCI